MDDETRIEYHIRQNTDIVIFRDRRLDESDYEVIVEELAAHDIIVEPAQSAGIGPTEWIVTLEWIRDQTEIVIYTAIVLGLGQRLWRHFRQKGASPPDRVNITEKGRTFTAAISATGESAGELRRLIFYGPERDFLRFSDELTKNGFGVYRISRIPSDFIAEDGETHPIALIAAPEFDEEADKILQSLIATLRSVIGEFRVYDMDGGRNL